MTGYRKQLQDLNIIKGISGCENIKNPGVNIEDNYFTREQRENDEQAGYPVEDHDTHGMGTRERSIWKSNKDFSKVEGDRVNRIMPEYAGGEEDFVSDKKQSDMGFVDMDKLRRSFLEGKFTLSFPITKRGTSDEKTICFLTSIADDSKHVMIAARTDGKGVYGMTSIEFLKLPKSIEKKELTSIEM